MRRLAFLFVLLVSACGSVDSGGENDGAPADPDASVTPTPDGTPAPDAFACEPSAFLACEDGGMRACNAQGTDTVLTPCDFGCNALAGRCNACTPSAVTCEAGDLLQTCDADGLVVEPGESCVLGCNPGDGGAVAAHCKTLAAAFVGDSCTTAASEDKVVAADENIDVNDDAVCSLLVDQPPVNGAAVPPICVLHWKSLTVQNGKTLKFFSSGVNRAVALVVDGAIQLDGIIDVSANLNANGPGFTVRDDYGATLGVSSGTVGGGGAGNQRAGGAGGNASANGGAANQGNARDLAAAPGLVGGARNHSNIVFGLSVPGGGGGGAITLVSCKAGITLGATGLVDAGGGGGSGGAFVQNPITLNSDNVGGGGGGSGGQIVLQAASGVNLAGALWANGGGGGGGGNDSQTPGLNGEDGGRTTIQALGGQPASGGGAGGKGGTRGLAPGVGNKAGTSVGQSGGGGGANGRCQIYAPAGAAITLSTTATNACAYDPQVAAGIHD